MDLSFSGAGFMGCYYFGVVNCWNKYIPRERVRRAAGASAGSLIAAYYLMELPLAACLKEIIEMTEDIRSRPLGVFDRSNQVVDILPRALQRLFPADAYKRVSGRLFIGMTRLADMKSVVVNEFESNKDLIDALNCSCFIPVWSGNHVATYKGVRHIDGGFTNNLPVFDEHTIRVCCFSGASDIAPFDRAQTDLSASLMGMHVNLTLKNLRRAGRALWPPPPGYIMELLERGFHDAKNFILTNDLIQCDSCFKAAEPGQQPIFSKLTPTISPSVSPSVSRAPSFRSAAGAWKPARESDSTRRRPPSGSDDNEEQQQPTERRATEAAALRRLERMLRAHSEGLPSVFEENRSKSGKQITAESLEQAARSKKRKSLTKRWRERLARVASSGRPSAANSSVEEKPQQLAAAAVPSIVVERARDESEPEDENEQEEEEEDAYELAREMAPHSPAEGAPQREDQHEQTSSASSDADSQADESSDSAVGGLRSSKSPPSLPSLPSLPSVARPALAGRRMSQSPAEKFLASRKLSLVASQLDLQRQAADAHDSLLPDRFAFAPSQLPSCPPSPNLNRHCVECSRLRQQARMDGLDQSIKDEAEKYGALQWREPEREFSGVRHRLASWFRQLGAPKYSYELAGDSHEQQHGTEAAQAGARRRHSEIPTFN